MPSDELTVASDSLPTRVRIRAAGHQSTDVHLFHHRAREGSLALPVYTVAEYVQRFNEIEAYLEETLKRIETTYDDCFEGCNVAFPPPDTSVERQRCVDGCEKTRRDGEFAARTAALEAHNELDDEARYTGLIPLPDVMIIIDRDLTYLLRDIKKESPWNNAAVVPVDSLFGLKEALRADRVVRSLLLVTYVEGGEISIGFELVSLAYLRQLSPLMRVNTYLELRGPTDGLGPGATEVQLFREALGAEESGARYQFGGVSLKVSVDGSDKNTRELSSRDPLSPYRHFVTVVGKSTEPVRLVASIDGVVTDEIKRALTWNATGGRIKPLKNNRLKATISRTDPKRVVVRVRVKGTVARTIIVWVVWCDLAAISTGTSPIDGQPLGLQGGRRDRSKQYWPEARIDWIAKIYPASIITDADRPFFKGDPVMVTFPTTSVESPAWEVVGQKRFKVERREGAKGRLKRIIERQWFSAEKIAETITNPYETGLPFGANVRWKRIFFDGKSFSGNGPNGSVERQRMHGRAFVRVELDGDWLRCSKYYYWRWHYFAQVLPLPPPALTQKRLWASEPRKTDLLDLRAPDSDL